MTWMTSGRRWADPGHRAFRPRDTNPAAQMSRGIRRTVAPAAEPEKGGPTWRRELGPPQSGRGPGRQTATSAVRVIAHLSSKDRDGPDQRPAPGPEPAPGPWVGLRGEVAAKGNA
jgi:hypothetical protein